MLDTTTVALEIGNRFALPDHAYSDIRSGLDALLRHGIVNEKTAPSYAKVMTDWLVKQSYVPNTTDMAELKAALENGARSILNQSRI